LRGTIFVAHFREESAMTGLGCGVVRRLGVAAAAIFALATVSQRAEALSLASLAAVPAAKHAADGLTTVVRHGGGGGGHGGGFHGGGFHGGGFHGGSFRGHGFHGGGFRAGGFAVHSGGYRYGGFHRFHHGGHRYAYRPYFHRHHHFHRRFYYAPSYYYPNYYYPYRRCRIIWTYYGPRKICRYRPWRHHRYW
jgi:hypothetical protein